MKKLILDIETTGLPPKGANYETDFIKFPRIVSISWKIDDGDTVTYIINQEGFPIPEEVTKIHGITNEEANKSKYYLSAVLKNLLIAGKDVDKIIGHGLYFDTSTIKANVLRLQEKDMYKEITELLHKDKRIDIMQKTIKFCGLKKYPTLTELYTKLFKEGFEAHQSKYDVNAIYECYNKLVELKVISKEGKKND